MKKLILAQRAGGATLPLLNVRLHKWRQVTHIQETQILTRYRLTLRGSLGEEGSGPESLEKCHLCYKARKSKQHNVLVYINSMSVNIYTAK